MAPRRFHTLLLALSHLLLGIGAAGCEFFEDEDELGDEDPTTEDPDPETTGEDPWPPAQGFRVFPKYLLQDVPATVSIDIAGEPMPCPIDVIGGGYLCDTADAPGPLAQLEVARDGFATLTPMPEIPVGLEDLEVHLYVEGGPPGVWSACAPAGAYASCDELCEAEMLGCAPTSCATEDPQLPVATILSFTDEACAEPLAPLIAGCADVLPEAGGTIASLQCCC